jgi:chemotaxis protein MotB
MMRWLLTYADMITLLLALFIILFSISTINKVKLQRLVHDLGGGFNSTDAINNPPNGQTVSATKDDLEAMQAQLQSYIQQNKIQSQVQTKITRDGKKRELIVSLLSDRPVYDSGSAELKPQTMKILDQVYLQVKPRASRATPTTSRSPTPSFRVTGNFPRRARPASRAISSNKRDSRPCASRRWDTASTGRSIPTTPRRIGRGTGASML